MNTIVATFINHHRPVLTILVLFLVAGGISFSSIPKEAEPDITIPQIYINIIHEGISPEDAERMLLRPMENELKTIESLKEMRSTASEGSAVVILEFEAGFDPDKALSDVREKVDLARTELPSDSEEPIVQEVNIALFPVLVVMLHGDVPERTLVSLARDLRDKIEGLPGVLDAEIGGDREELLEIVVDPSALESYNLSFIDIANSVSRNNRLVAAGALDTGEGRFSIKVPGVIENYNDLMTMPIKQAEGRTVTFKDVAEIKRGFKDPASFARINGERSVALEISKRGGSNIIEVVDAVKSLVVKEKELWPRSVQVTVTQDNSEQVRVMLNDLVNNVAIAVILVMIVVLGVLGFGSAGLVGISIPGSFLAGIFIINILGYSMNIVVLFGLIMAVGMLVDGAIVVVERAQRNLALGHSAKQAYFEAASVMSWPIIASTATTLAAFMPLLFWPGILGEFMKYLPITLLITLTMSLFMALLFVPTIGALSGSRKTTDIVSLKQVSTLEEARESLENINRYTRRYLQFVKVALRHPLKVLISAFVLLLGTVLFYSEFGQGVEFFPEVEPEVAQINVHARGDLSVWERDALVREVETKILPMREFKSVYARSGLRMGNDAEPDLIGRIQVQLIDWELRRPAAKLMQEVRLRTEDIAGIRIETELQETGITSGKPVQLELSALNPDILTEAIVTIRNGMNDVGGFTDIVDNRTLPGIDWRVEVDREKAARFGADVSLVGSAVQLLTNGIMLSDYRPDNADDEVEIRIRFPEDMRNLTQLGRLTVGTANGMVPIANFVQTIPATRVGQLERTDSRRVMKIAANVEEGLLVNDKVLELQEWLANQPPVPGLSVNFRGENEDQQEAQEFLSKAFGFALFLMAIILVTQFNSFYQTGLILSAVMFSTIGVLLALLLTGRPFGIVMSGIGVISLAGIVVNNNIVLIDTFNVLRTEGAKAIEAAYITCAQRLRPVLLTTITTILGLMPMAIGMNFDILDRHIELGGPTTQWWTQLATAIAGGLAFSTVLTLILTPCLLVLGEGMFRKVKN